MLLLVRRNHAARIRHACSPAMQAHIVQAAKAKPRVPTTCEFSSSMQQRCCFGKPLCQGSLTSPCPEQSSSAGASALAGGCLSICSKVRPARKIQLCGQAANMQGGES